MYNKFSFSVFFSLAAILATAQEHQQEPYLEPSSRTIEYVVNKVPVTPLPFEAKKYGKEVAFPPEYSFPISNRDRAIPDRLYSNVQLTKYGHAIQPESWGISFRKFALPDNKFLLVFSFGGLSPDRTDVICSVTPTGQVLDTLEVAVAHAWLLSIKQFRITDRRQIIVTTIHALSKESIPLESFTSFEGYRQDVTYSVNEKGKFVKVKTQTFQPKTYTREYLEERDSDLWKGGETPKE